MWWRFCLGSCWLERRKLLRLWVKEYSAWDCNAIDLKMFFPLTWFGFHFIGFGVIGRDGSCVGFKHNCFGDRACCFKKNSIDCRSKQNTTNKKTRNSDWKTFCFPTPCPPTPFRRPPHTPHTHTPLGYTPTAEAEWQNLAATCRFGSKELQSICGQERAQQREVTLEQLWQAWRNREMDKHGSSVELSRDVPLTQQDDPIARTDAMTEE